MEQFTIREKTYNIILDRSEYFANAKNFNKDNEIKMNDDEFKEFTANIHFLVGEIGFHMNDKSFLMLNDKYLVRDEDFDFRIISQLIYWVNYYSGKTCSAGNSLIPVVMTIEGIFEYMCENNVQGEFAVAVVEAAKTCTKTPIVEFLRETFDKGTLYNYLIWENNLVMYGDVNFHLKAKFIEEFKHDMIIKMSYIKSEKDIVISWEYNKSLIALSQKTDDYVRLMKSFAAAVHEMIFKMLLI